MNDAPDPTRPHALMCAGKILARADAILAGQFDLHDLFAPGRHAAPATVRQEILSEGHPLYSVEDWPIKPEAPELVLAVVHEAWEQALSYCPKYGSLLDTRPAFSDASALVHRALEGRAPRTEGRGDADESGEVFALVEMLVVRPFLRTAAKALLEDLSIVDWRHRRCPIRGYPPAMAILVGDTHERLLWCQWCDTRWNVDRLGCVFCGNQDVASLRYFETDPPSALRIDVCDCCKGYIKTCDMNQLPAETPLGLLELELTSSGLDAAISKRGFSPHWIDGEQN